MRLQPGAVRSYVIQERNTLNNISNCAKNLGIVFQIKDDLLDYLGNEVELGKPAFQDIKEGKVTYPFYFAYKNANSNEKKILDTMLGNKKVSHAKVSNIINKAGWNKRNRKSCI